jgi:hypothetical protein
MSTLTSTSAPLSGTGPTTTTTTTTTVKADEHGEVVLTKELNQLSFKDRNDYQGKFK